MLKKIFLHISLFKLSTELYEISKFCLVVTNGSCPLPHLECLQAWGTFCRHFLYHVGSVLEQGGTLPLPTKKNGKAADEGWRRKKGVKRREREPLLSSRKVTGFGKAHRVTLPLTATGSMFGK